jgi:hypothetical protein
MLTHGNNTLPCVKSGKTGQKVMEINAFSAPTDLQTRCRRVSPSFHLLAINCLVASRLLNRANRAKSRTGRHPGARRGQ